MFSVGCGTSLLLGEVMMIDGSQGDWQTNFATPMKQRDDRNYIMVSSKTETRVIRFTGKKTNKKTTILIKFQLKQNFT